MSAKTQDNGTPLSPTPRGGFPIQKYFTAFGVNGRYFFRTPNGYAAASLPIDVVRRIGRGTEDEVLFASFSDNPQQWFVTYKDLRGQISHHLAPATPSQVIWFCNQQRRVAERRDVNAFRIQYGASGSFLAWTPLAWISRDIPAPLLEYLVASSKATNFRGKGGVFGAGFPEAVAWHGDGSFFAIKQKPLLTDDGQRCKDFSWYFASPLINESWECLWNYRRHGAPTEKQLQELIHVGFNPHGPTGNHVFIRRSEDEHEPDFVLCIAPGSDNLVARLNRQAEQHFTWARAKQTGRPHPADTRELFLKKDEMIKIVEEKGKDWVYVQNWQGERGYAHKSMLDYNYRLHLDAKEAYTRFRVDTEKLLVGTITSFPDLSLYVHVCSRTACKEAKEGTEGLGLGVCKHELERLLRGAGTYTHAFLKEERNKWHPDKFSGRCDAALQAALTKKTEQMFVLISTLMEDMESALKETTQG